MLAAEGHVHKRQRRVATPAFSIQNLKALVPLVFRKGNELKDKWFELLDKSQEGTEIDICHWISRAAFDVIGLAGETLFSLVGADNKISGRQGLIITSTLFKTSRTSFLLLTEKCLKLPSRSRMNFERCFGYISPFSALCS